MKILLTGAYSYTDEHIEKIENLGFETDFVQYEKDEILYEEYDGVICNGLFLHHDIDNFTKLKYIQLTSVGYDRVPIERINEKGIQIRNAGGVYSIPIAEHTVLKILEFYKKSRSFYEKQKLHLWDKERSIFELYNKHVAIIGCGNIGTEISKRLKGFGVEITGVDIYEVKNDYIDHFEKPENIHKVLARCDIVILTLPLTEDTRGFIGKKCFEIIKKDSLLVNVSRGPIVDEKAMIHALENGDIGGAALDVFEEEPLFVDSKLWDMENVMITPHNSFIGEYNSKRMFDVIYKNLKEWKEKYKDC